MSETQGCNECKKKSLFQSVTPMLIMGFYITGTSIYGTYALIKEIISLFK